MSPSQPEPRSTRRFRIPVTLGAIALLTLLKLWLVHGEEICGSATRYDALWFVNSAAHWYWGADYSWTAFVRPPAYPLWLTLTQAFGVRQRLAIELLQLGGYAALVFSLRGAGLPRAVCIGAFAAACFHPGSFQLNNYTMADPFYAAVMPYALAAMITLMLRRSIAAATVAGGTLAVLWVTREESVLIALLIVVFLALCFVRDRLAGTRKPVAVMLGVFAALVLVVYAANCRTYRAFAKSDMTAPAFEAAFRALIRIKPQSFQRYVPVPAESLNIAFAVSPEFSKLRPQLDGPTGVSWRTETHNRLGIDGEIGINWLLWAIRDAAGTRGIHESPEKAQRFYRKVARQINDACDDKRIESRLVWASFIGPNLFREAHQLPGSLARLLSLFIARYEITPVRDDEILLPEERVVYDQVTLRRAPESFPTADNALAHRTEQWWGSYHCFFVMALALTGAASLFILLAKKRSLSLRQPLDFILLLFAFAILSRVGLFTVIDATSWPVAYERFLFPVMPLTSVFLLVLITRAWLLLRSPVAAR